MLPIHVILHPTDFSERSGHALRLAAALARDYGARLAVLHVAATSPLIYSEGSLPLDPRLLVEEARAQLDQLQLPINEHRSERHLVEGDAATEILRLAQEMHADLIVMGTHGRTGLARMLMGSVAEQVVRKAPCPVLTVTVPHKQVP